MVQMLGNQKLFHQPHHVSGDIGLSIETGAQQSFIIPIINYDEGMGAPDAVNTHPQNSAFAPSTEPNICVESVVKTWKGRIDFSRAMNSGAKYFFPIKTFYWPIYTAFKKDIDEADEKTGTTLGSIIRMQKETTDRQAYPLFSGVDLADRGDSIPPANQLGVGANLWEDVGITETNWEVFHHDARRYYSTKGLLKRIVPWIRSFTLFENSVKSLFFKGAINSKVKRANQYMFCGIGIYSPHVHNKHSLALSTDVNDVPTHYLHWDFEYMEQNSYFDSARV